MSNKLLLLTPPFTQLNTPYPATAYLLGYLLSKDINASQVDLGRITSYNVCYTKLLRAGQNSAHSMHELHLVLSIKGVT